MQTASIHYEQSIKQNNKDIADNSAVYLDQIISMLIEALQIYELFKFVPNFHIKGMKVLCGKYMKPWS